MKYIKKEKKEYEVFHIRVPSELASAVRAYADLHGISLNSTFVELSREYLSIIGLYEREILEIKNRLRSK